MTELFWHRNLTDERVHTPFFHVYADETEREAATGFVPEDVNKVALQLDDATLWALSDDSPITWIQVGGTYTDEKAQDAIGAMIADTDTVNITYTDATPELKADVVKQMSITSDGSGLKLVNDETSPGNNQVYGTDGSGVKGWKNDPAGGSGIEWNLIVNESGASFANFTSGGGTWSSDGTVVKQTDTGSAWRTAQYNTQCPLGLPFVFEAVVKLVSTGGASLRMLGLVAGYTGTTGGAGGAVELRNDSGTKKVVFDRAMSTEIFNLTYNWGSEDTFYTMRFVSNGGLISLYVDGTLVATGGNGLFASGDARYIGFVSYGCEAHFKDIKLYVLDLP